MKLLILNGPNLNLLGLREPDIYGKGTYRALCRLIQKKAKDMHISVMILQTNHEGRLVEAIQRAYGKYDGIVINPAAYTHTSVAILDALKAVAIPAVEVHLTDVSQREEFRNISYAGLACEQRYIGMGFEGYKKAIAYLAKAKEEE